MDQKDKNQNQPWYKYPMVWFVIFLPSAAVIASIITLVIASNNAPQIIDRGETHIQNSSEPEE